MDKQQTPHQLFDLSGRVALVTGGNGGLGLGMALGLARAGASIMVAARNTEKNHEAVAQIKTLGVGAANIEVDVTEESSIRAMVARSMEQMGRVDILVNNAGVSVRKQPQDISALEWDRVVDTNLRASFLVSREVYPHMKAQGGGKIINIGSMFSLFGSDWTAPYASSKAGVVQLTKSLASSWARDNIQANAILPGWFLTDLTAVIPDAHPERYDLINRRLPAGRWGRPEELQGAVIFFASHASDYVTGAVLTVDGGYAAV